MTDALIIFAKNPQLGKTKTRIGNQLGDEVALAVYFQLLNRAQQITQLLRQDKFVFYSDFIDKEDSWSNEYYKKEKQLGNDLGARMSDAMNKIFADGYEKVVLIGTDIYELTGDIINEAFEKLNDHDMVLGPAKDGGYYLIGLKKPNPSVFKLSKWSTNMVLEETLQLAKKSSLNTALLQELNDIDEPEDMIGTDLERLMK